MKVTALMLSFLALPGCANLDGIMAAEGAWQAAHVIDVAQTYDGPASDQCYRESDPTTQFIIGPHPKRSDTILWGVGYSAFHYGITRLLQHVAPPWVVYVWQGISIADQIHTDAHNYSLGIRIGSPNTDFPACPKWARGVPPH